MAPIGSRQPAGHDEEAAARCPFLGVVRADWQGMSTAVRRSLIAVLLLIAAAAVVGLTQLDGSTSNATTAIIQSISPADNDKILQQEPIIVDLESGWDGRLTIAERAIPDDQLEKVPQQSKFTFTPGPGKAFEFFPAGQNCAEITYWPVLTPEQTFTHRWCFTVV